MPLVLFLLGIIAGVLMLLCSDVVRSRIRILLIHRQISKDFQKLKASLQSMPPDLYFCPGMLGDIYEPDFEDCPECQKDKAPCGSQPHPCARCGNPFGKHLSPRDLIERMESKL